MDSTESAWEGGLLSLKEEVLELLDKEDRGITVAQIQRQLKYPSTDEIHRALVDLTNDGQAQADLARDETRDNRTWRRARNYRPKGFLERAVAAFIRW